MRAETTCDSNQAQAPVRDLTTGSIHRAIWYLAPAMVLETAILNVADLLDVYWVSRLGAAALAAFTMSITIRWFVNSVAMGLGIGGLAMVARRTGARDQEAASHATGQTILLGFLLSAGLTAIGLALARPLLQLLGADAEVMSLGLPYLRITFLGSFTWVLLYVINPLFRGVGDARLAMRVLLLTTVVIVFTEPVLVLGLGPVPRLGVNGSALASVLGFGAGLALQLASLVRGRSCLRLRLRHLRPNLPLMGRIIRISLPSAIQMALRAAASMVMLTLVGVYGTFATAGYGLADRFLFLVLVPCFGLGNASGTLTGQNLGAGKPQRAERSAWWVSAYAAGYLLPLTTLLFVFARPIVAFFDPTPEVVAIGAACIRVVAFSVVLDGIGFVLGRSLDGAGNTLPAAAINLLTLWGLQIPAAVSLSRLLGLGLTGVWWGRALANIGNAFLFFIWFRRGKWKEREI